MNKWKGNLPWTWRLLKSVRIEGPYQQPYQYPLSGGESRGTTATYRVALCTYYRYWIPWTKETKQIYVAFYSARLPSRCYEMRPDESPYQTLRRMECDALGA